jgi:hypothetical protein
VQAPGPAEEARLVSADGRVSLRFPAGSTTGGTVIRYRGVPVATVHPPPSGFRLGSLAFLLDAVTITGESLTALPKPFDIALRYQPADLTAGGDDVSSLFIGAYDAEAARWLLLETRADPATALLHASTRRLGQFALMIRSPLSPVPAAAPPAIGPAPLCLPVTAVALAAVGLLLLFVLRRRRA